MIGELVIVPPLMVIASTSMPSVMLFAGKVITPVALKFVVVTFVNEPLMNDPLVEARFEVKKFVVVSDPPMLFVKVSPDEKRFVDVTLPKATWPRALKLVEVRLLPEAFVKVRPAKLVSPVAAKLVEVRLDEIVLPRVV